MTHRWLRPLQGWSAIWLTGLLVLGASCNPGPVVRVPELTTPQRLTQAATIIVGRIGTNADEVAYGFRIRLAGLSDEAIALQAARQSGGISSIKGRIESGSSVGRTQRGHPGPLCPNRWPARKPPSWAG